MRKAKYELVDIRLDRLLEMEKAGTVLAPQEMRRKTDEEFAEDYCKSLAGGSYVHPLVFGRLPDSDQLVLVDGSRRLEALKDWARKHDPALIRSLSVVCAIEQVNGLYDAYSLASKLNFHQVPMNKFDALRMIAGPEIWRMLMNVQERLVEISGMQLRWPDQGEGVFLMLQVFWAWRHPRELVAPVSVRLASEWEMSRWAMERFRLAVLKKTEARMVIARYVRCLRLIRNVMGPRMFYLRDPSEYKSLNRIYIPHSTHFSMMTACGLLDIPWKDPHPASIAAVRRKVIAEIEESGRYESNPDSPEQRGRDFLVRSRVREMRRIFAEFLCRSLGMDPSSGPAKSFCSGIRFCRKCKNEIRSPLEADPSLGVHVFCMSKTSRAQA